MSALACTALMASCSRQDDRSVLDKQPGYVCQRPATTVYAGWGPNGLSKACVGPNGKLEGTFMTAEGGHIFYVENFDAETRQRVMTFFDASGQVVQRVTDIRRDTQ